jgi:hypothetical protein
LDGRISYCAPHIAFEFFMAGAPMAVAHDNQNLTLGIATSSYRAEARLLWSDIVHTNRLMKIAAWIAVVLLAVCTVLCWLDISNWPMWR